MVRPHGISRRGSISAARGCSRGRGGSSPRRISPLTSVRPASLNSDHSGPSLNSSLHSARFKFKSRLNKPSISALITVIFSEEEDELSDSAESSKERSLSTHSSDSQSSKAGVVLNNPTVLQEDVQQEDSRHQQESSNEEIIACAPTQFSGVMHLVTSPGCNMMEVEDNVMVHWVSSPSKANEKDTDLPTQDYCPMPQQINSEC